MHLGLGLLAATAVAAVSGDRGPAILNLGREGKTLTNNIPAMLSELAEGSEAGMAAAQTMAQERGEAFVVSRDKTSRLTGVRHTKLEQYYGGRRVFPGLLTRHEPPTGKGEGKWLSGSYAAGVRADVGATDDVSDADAAAKMQQLAAAAIAADEDAERREQAFFDEQHGEVVIYVAGEGTAARLAFYIYFVLKMGNAVYSRLFYIVDARTGESIRQWKGLDKQLAQVGEGPGGNIGPYGSYVYDGIDKPKFWVVQSDGTCYMHLADVSTVDLRTGISHRYPCFYYDGDSVNGGASPLNDGHTFGKEVLNFYLDWYGENPIGMQLLMLMHWEANNAVWTGTQMQYGNGDGIEWYPFVSLEVTAHEVASLFRGGRRRQGVQVSHGFTELNSALIYAEMSGGINEAFSDMMGEAAEFWYYGQADWKIGVRIRVDGQPVRWMDDPLLDGVSIDHADNFIPGMDVHFSSGVYNKAFYLMATDFANVHTAMDLFYCANEAYWTPDSTFDAGATDVAQCALDLGVCVKPVYCAFTAVGVTMGSLDSVCNTNPCVNGVCINVAGAAVCRCCDGFGGPTCAISGDPCNPMTTPCQNGATCTVDAICATATCVCPPGYTGEICDADIDECAEGLIECDANAQCTNTEGSALCDCNEGYTGDGFTCTDIDECAEGLLVCGLHAQCINTDGSAMCACDDGYTGDGFTCTDIDECAEGLIECDVNAQCTNTEGSALCDCNEGYTGDGFTCTDIDECAEGLIECDVNAQCINTEGSALCDCNNGYTGDGFTCTAIDNCADLECDVNAQCINTEDSVLCDCNEGYTGDGFTCTDIDECAEGLLVCGLHAQCINTDGSAMCACDDGYTGDGLTCTDIDECAGGLIECDANAECTNTEGSALCDCNTGYTGDGFTCTVGWIKSCSSQDGPVPGNIFEGVLQWNTHGFVGVHYSAVNVFGSASDKVFHTIGDDGAWYVETARSMYDINSGCPATLIAESTDSVGGGFAAFFGESNVVAVNAQRWTHMPETWNGDSTNCKRQLDI